MPIVSKAIIVNRQPIKNWSEEHLNLKENWARRIFLGGRYFLQQGFIIMSLP